MIEKHFKNKYSYEDEFCLPPRIDSFIRHKWWSNVEAAFMLTEWPISGLFLCTISPKEIIPDDVREDRNSFYLPGAGDGFFPKKYGTAFQGVFRELEDDINYGRVRARHVRIDIGVNYLIEPFEAINWAIRKKYKIPQNLEEALFVKVKRQRQENPWHKKVRNMIAGQFYFLDNPRATFSEIIRSGLMKKYGTETFNENQEMQVRKDLKVVLEEGVPGRPKCLIGSCSEKMKPFKRIPEVLSEAGGYICCDFDLLKTVIAKAVIIIRDENLGMKRAMSLSEFEFIEHVSNHPLVQIYLRDAPPFIMKFIITVVKREYEFIKDLIQWDAVARYFTANPSWKIKLNSLEEKG